MLYIIYFLLQNLLMGIKLTLKLYINPKCLIQEGIFKYDMELHFILLNTSCCLGKQLLDGISMACHI